MGQRSCPYCGKELAELLFRGRLGVHAMYFGGETCPASGLSPGDAAKLALEVKGGNSPNLVKGEPALGYCPICRQSVLVYENDTTVPEHREFPIKRGSCPGVGSLARRVRLKREFGLGTRRGSGGSPEFPSGFHN